MLVFNIIKDKINENYSLLSEHDDKVTIEIYTRNISNIYIIISEAKYLLKYKEVMINKIDSIFI